MKQIRNYVKDNKNKWKNMCIPKETRIIIAKDKKKTRDYWN